MIDPVHEATAQRLLQRAQLGQCKLNALEADARSSVVFLASEENEPRAVVKIPQNTITKVRAEAAALSLVQEAGLGLAPELLHAAFGKKNAGLVLGHRPGKPLDAVAGELDEATLAAIGQELGAWLGKLHGLTVPEGGNVRFSTDPLSWAERMRQQTRRAAERLHKRHLHRMKEPVRERVERALEALEKAIVEELTEAPPRGLVHRDLRPANLLVDDGHLVAVLDFERAGAADPAWEFAKLRGWVLETYPAMAEPCLSAYASVRPLPPEGRQRLYRLFEAIGLLAYFWGKHPTYPNQALAWLADV